MRRLGIPCVLDRVIMQSIAKVLGELFNPTFSESSYGYRPERSVQQAARKAQEYYRQGYIHQVESVSPETICSGLSRKSYWRLSKTLAANAGLSNAHFDQIGFISVRTLWCKIHHPATAR
ncbi:MAG: hypothetical protein GY820_06430 [Gammaproteobacteria bacterium]|nr:hypothetical protein [Gammaproteobacteria bacterium]